MLRLIGLFLALGLASVVVRRWRRRAQPPRLRTPASGVPANAAALVSIIVPARDEADTVEACVRSLLAQDYPRFEVIVVNDRSKDATGTILDRLAAADRRLTVVRGDALPPGWMGKAHAIVQAYKRSRGDWLLFTDADTVHAPWLLSSVMDALRDSPASFATAFGAMWHPSPAAYLMNLAVLVYVNLTAHFARLPDPSSRYSIVTGQYVIFTREAYESIGTHAAVRKYSSTDVSLGYLAKLQGWRGAFFDARDGLQTRMYRSAGEAFRGSSRSMVNGAWTALGRKWGSFALGIQAVTMFMLWMAPWMLIARAVWAGDRLAVALGAICAIGGLVLMHLHGRSVLGPQAQGPWGTAAATAAMPLSSAIFVAMAATGLAEAVWRGGMVWKGRVVRTPHRLPLWEPEPPRSRGGR